MTSLHTASNIEVSRSRSPSQHIEMQDHVEVNTLANPEEETPPSHAVNIAPRWNESKAMIWRVTATFWCALVMGANDAAYGAIIPYVCLILRS